MITYNSKKYNNLKKKILEILKVNNINTFDSESIISSEVLEILTSEVQKCFISPDKFLTEKCPKCEKKSS